MHAIELRRQVLPAGLRLSPAVHSAVGAGEDVIGPRGMARKRPDSRLVAHAELAVRARPGLAEVFGEPDGHADGSDVELGLHEPFLCSSRQAALILWQASASVASAAAVD